MTTTLFGLTVVCVTLSVLLMIFIFFKIIRGFRPKEEEPVEVELADEAPTVEIPGRQKKRDLPYRSFDDREKMINKILRKIEKENKEKDP